MSERCPYFELFEGRRVKMSEFTEPVEIDNIKQMVDKGEFARQYLLFEPGDSIIFKRKEEK